MATMKTMKTQSITSKTFINSSGRKVLEHLSSDTTKLDLPFILTEGKCLTTNMPYMKLEKRIAGDDVAAIRLLNFHDDDGMVYLNVQDLKSNRCYTLSWNMEYEGDYWLWSIADMSQLALLK